MEIAAPSENLHVTYIGLAASLNDKQAVDNSDLFFGEKIPVLLDSQGECAEVSDELYVCCCRRAYFALEVGFILPRPSYELKVLMLFYFCWMKVDIWNPFVPC